MPTHVEELVLEPGRGYRNYWRDLWRYRELFYILAWRDIAVRYKQTVIGILWAVLTPLVLGMSMETKLTMVPQRCWKIGSDRTA